MANVHAISANTRGREGKGRKLVFAVDRAQTLEFSEKLGPGREFILFDTKNYKSGRMLGHFG